MKTRITVLSAAMMLCASTAFAAPVVKYHLDHAGVGRYLDPSIWHITVKENECFFSAPQALLQVQPVVTEQGVRVYKITQVVDAAEARKMYAVSLEDQIKNHKIVGREFCNGVVSNPDLNIPFSKQASIELDENDGLLVTDKIRDNAVAIQNALITLRELANDGANGVYSSSQLWELDQKFQSHLNEVEHIAEKAQFNGIFLLNGDHEYLNIPINDMASVVSITLSNLSAGSAGLGISGLSVDSEMDAATALGRITTAISTVYTGLARVNAERINLDYAVRSDVNITLVDVSNDAFEVQHIKGSDAIKHSRQQS